MGLGMFASLVMGFAQWRPSITKTAEVLRSYSKDESSWSHDELAALVVDLTDWEPSHPKTLAAVQAQTGWEDKVTWNHEELGDMIGRLAEQDSGT